MNIALLNRLRRASGLAPSDAVGLATSPPPRPSPARGEGANSNSASGELGELLAPSPLAGEGRGGGDAGPALGPEAGFVPIANLGADPADLDELEAFGFRFERHPYLGVAYRGPSPRLCPDQIEWELQTKLVGRRIAVWNRVTSTNNLAARAAASTSNDGLVILAEEQSNGRGSRGRSWSSPPRSSLLMSVLLFPGPSMADLGWLTALGAVAVAEVVSELGGLDARIKWPNDVRVGGRKLAGVLVERGQGTVLGIGLNVNVAEFPEEIRDSATSLQRLLGRSLDRSEVARALIRRLDFHYRRGSEDGVDSLNAPYRRLSEHFGREVEVNTKSEAIAGRLVGLDLRAGLTIEGPNGLSRLIAGREVSSIVDR